MGICLSCLRGGEDDDQSRIDENAPLLDNENRDYDKDAELRRREEELNQIVGETNENLIDIANFINTNPSLEQSLKKSITSHNDGSYKEPENSATGLTAKPISSDKDFITVEERGSLEVLNHKIFQLLYDSVKIEKKGPLIVDFDA